MHLCICVCLCVCMCVGECAWEKERDRQSPPIIVIVEKHKFSLFIYWVTFADVNSPKDTHQNDSSYEDVLLGIVYVSPSVCTCDHVCMCIMGCLCASICAWVACIHACVWLVVSSHLSVFLFVCQTDPHLLSSSFVLFLCCLVLTHSVTTVYHTL